MLDFKRWEDVPSNFKTEKQLRRMHLVPESDFLVDGILDNEEWDCVFLYDMIKAVYVIPKEMHIIPAVELPLTRKNLMIALKTVMESKYKRELVIEEYPEYAKYHKNQKIELEELENKVLEKFKRDGIKIKYPKNFEDIRVKDAIATLQEYVEEK